MAEARIGVLGLGAYVPERVMSNEEWAEYVDTSDEWITTRTGIKRRHLAAEDESTADLALAAAKRALADAGLGTGDDGPSVLVLSEPLDDVSESWQQVEEATLLIAGADGIVVRPFAPAPAEA